MQKQILVSQGFGLLRELPYIEAEQVQEIMRILEKCLKEIQAKINQKGLDNPLTDLSSGVFAFWK